DFFLAARVVPRAARADLRLHSENQPRRRPSTSPSPERAAGNPCGRKDGGGEASFHTSTSPLRSPSRKSKSTRMGALPPPKSKLRGSSTGSSCTLPAGSSALLWAAPWWGAGRGVGRAEASAGSLLSTVGEAGPAGRRRADPAPSRPDLAPFYGLRRGGVLGGTSAEQSVGRPPAFGRWWCWPGGSPAARSSHFPAAGGRREVNRERIQVVVFHCELRGCPPFGASAPSPLFLLVGPSNFMPGFHSPTIPPARFPPLVRRWMVGRGIPDVLRKVAPSASKGKVVVSGEPWFAPLPLPLVPTPLA
ncbi:unnamed protein product, partial [Urochloa humidicola]